MIEYSEVPDAPVAAAVELRARLRALAVGQTEAFGLISQEIGAVSQIGMTAERMATRRPPSSRSTIGREEAKAQHQQLLG